tara:strand:- start:756 stop:908 length:153 start_codon:yes stop_codon:yes gene_type:complete
MELSAPGLIDGVKIRTLLINHGEFRGQPSNAQKTSRIVRDKKATSRKGAM